MFVADNWKRDFTSSGTIIKDPPRPNDGEAFKVTQSDGSVAYGYLVKDQYPLIGTDEWAKDPVTGDNTLITKQNFKSLRIKLSPAGGGRVEATTERRKTGDILL